jgi:hypothetical protein
LGCEGCVSVFVWLRTTSYGLDMGLHVCAGDGNLRAELDIFGKKTVVSINPADVSAKE